MRVRELIPGFVDMGVDVSNSPQPKAAGLDSVELQREFGSEIVFHCGLDIQQGGITGSVREATDKASHRSSDRRQPRRSSPILLPR
jgi:hypothetical protein